MNTTPRQITLLAHDTPDVTAFMTALAQALQSREPATGWQVQRLDHPVAHNPQHLFLWSQALSWESAAAPDAAASQETERACRQALLSSGECFQVLQGDTQQRINTVLSSLGLLPDTAQAQARQFALNGGRTPWRCESCSDPDCEHRLFTGLLGRP